MKKPLVAVVLAGGVGKRFWPIRTNKLLLPFNGREFINWTVIDMIPEEVDKIVVISNQDNNSSLMGLKWPKPVVFVIQPEAQGMADAMLTAKSQLEGTRLLIYIADHYAQKTLYQDLLKQASQSKAFAILSGYEVEKYEPMGYFEFDGNSIRGIKEKPGEGNEPSRFVNITGHYFSDSDILLSELSKTSGSQDDMYERALSKLMKHTEFNMLSYQGISETLKYPWNILDVMKIFLNEQKSAVGKNVDIKGNVILEGPVWIEDNVKIFENTKITGPVFIGKNSIIGNNNIIRQSYIGAGCVTGFNSDITRSYIGENCWFHSNYIGESVLEGNVSMGSGSVLANLRLDEKQIFSNVNDIKTLTNRNKLGALIGRNVRIGVNVSIMPGVKVGESSFIGAGAVVDKDVPDKTFMYVKNSVNIVNNNASDTSPDREEYKKNI